MPAKLPASSPGARTYRDFLGYLGAGLALAFLLYEVLRYVSAGLERGML